MEEAPKAIREYLLALAADRRSPAWLFVDRQGRIVSSGGALAEYGLNGLQPGTPAVDHAEFLIGLLPLDGSSLILPCVTTQTAGAADVHLLPAADGDWVLLLDAAEEMQRRQGLQQKANDLALLQEREAKALAQLRVEREKSERLLLSLFPKAIAERLKDDAPGCIAQDYPDVTVLFADIHGFWNAAGSLVPPRFIELLNAVFSLFDQLADKHGVQKIKTIGDAYMAVSGLPEPRADHAVAMAEMALSMRREIAGLRTGLKEPFSIRVGLHSGPVIAGVVGTRKLAYDLWGPTVNLASQMEMSGLPGGIQVSSATFELLESEYRFEPRGKFYVKGQGEVATYLLEGRRHR